MKCKTTGSLEKQHPDYDLSNEPQDNQENSWPFQAASSAQKDKQPDITVKSKNKNEDFLDQDQNNLSSSNPFMNPDSNSNEASEIFKLKNSNYSQGSMCRKLEEMLFHFKSFMPNVDFCRILKNHIPKNNDQCINTSTQFRNSDYESDEIYSLKAQIHNLEHKLQLYQSTESNLKNKNSWLQERSVTLEKLIRDRESTIYNLKSEKDELSTELSSAKLMEEQLKTEIDMVKGKKNEIEEKLKQVKTDQGRDSILIRQLKDDVDTKKKEMIEACNLTARVSSELEEVRFEVLIWTIAHCCE